MSLVEQTLCEDTGGVYGKMDFVTRDRYRHVIEKAAKRSPYSESEVARKAIQLAHQGAARKGSDGREAHVGFYLIDQGLAQLERMAKVRLSAAEVLRKVGRRFPLAAVCRRYPAPDRDLRRRLSGEGFRRWFAGLGAGADRIPLAYLHQLSGAGPGELAGYITDDAAPTAAHGFLRGNSAGIANSGGSSRRCSRALKTSKI